ncbi:hypothetical protein crov374 [Cafeteria roenbergensis virus]|uniref:Uncharacterized protein n=1 Tax=Cafeteria roenbergensis virus (strain BV-PW1) TaxID=693272 RepID=E3T5E5_CROVB|nr:hypothetical protein crov374 [Cafeteria roenbergensis virus BV-PW1]ADO67408.1 hypothetical protein crov374 [Cafeteria roenbergensis virus BV-PW1]
MARKSQLIELEDSDADTVSSVSDDNESVASSHDNESDEEPSKKLSKKLKASKNIKVYDNEESDDEFEDGSDVEVPKKTSKKLKASKNIETSDGEDSDEEDSDDETTKKQVKKTTLKSTKSTKKTSTSKSTPTKTASSKVTKNEKDDDKDFSLENTLEDFDKKFKIFSQMEQKLTDLQTEVKEVGKEYKNALRIFKKEFHMLQVLLGKEFKLISKQKKKSPTDRKKGGITMPKPVPVKLCEYLGIPTDSVEPRPNIVKKCYDEFKKRNMNMGQRIYKFDKETSKIFGKKKDEEFHIKDFQTILKGVYDKELENKETL